MGQGWSMELRELWNVPMNALTPATDSFSSTTVWNHITPFKQSDIDSLLYHWQELQHTIQTAWHCLSPLPLSEITAHHSNSLTLTLSFTTVRNHSTPFKQSDIDSLLYHWQESQHTIQSDTDSLLYHCQKSQHTIQTVWHWLSPLPLSEITANTPFKQSDTVFLLYHCQKSQHTIQTVWHWLSPLPLSGITAHHSLIQSDIDSLLYHWQESQHTIQSDIDSLLYHCQKSQHTIQTVWHWLSPLPLTGITAHHSNSLTLTLSSTTVRNHSTPFKQSDTDSLPATVWSHITPFSLTLTLPSLPLSEITAHHSNSLTLTLSSTTVRNHSTPFSLTLTLSSTTVRNHSTPFKQSDTDSLLYHCLKSHHTIQTVWHWLSPLPLSEITAHHSNSLTLTLSSTTVRNHSAPFKQSDTDSLLYHCLKSHHTIQTVWHSVGMLKHKQHDSN